MTQTQSTPALETKVAGAPANGDLTGAFDEFMQAFEAFKDANDDRLTEIERRMAADVVTEEKVQRINTALDEYKRVVDDLALKAHRPGLEHGGGDAGRNAHAGEHKAAFQAYVRKGEAHNLTALEAKALSVGSDPDGGYLVPEETEAEIGRMLASASPIRAIAGVRQVSGSVYKKPFATSGAATGWVGETDARPETAAPTLAELQFPTMELYAMPAATQSLLDDAAVNIDQWIAEEVQTVFAEQEGAAFVNGDGVAKPRGFLDYPVVDDGSWSWGSLGTVATGVDGGLPASDAGDVLIDLVYALKSGYRQNAHWVMNRKTQAEIRKIKDADGNYLWQPAAQAGGAATLMTAPIAEAEEMPDIGSDALAVAFGDFRRGYLIVDRLGVRILRDPYSSKPYVLFYTTKRVGGGVQNFEAIKLLKFGVS
ncbi:phage major capsid protein [Kaustia mangrovi]|uniref:Phage major capsid protein n=1 Tax=Kaustia mangrovi TaxID=2593653 RepID=A0A7S8HAV9_9HYPH|nr:phage major capsid protein [Kaustia mangrovi]QPC41997.1 phage major capsid protein [Kaustia mangrovi]